MSRRVFLTRTAQDDLDDLDPPVRKRVLAKFLRFARIGHGDVKKLQGDPDRWRLRAGDWRVLFRPAASSDVDALVILRVLPRDQAYR